MPITGDGDFPLRSPWLGRGRRFQTRGYLLRASRQGDAASVAAWSDWFFEAAGPVTSTGALTLPALGALAELDHGVASAAALTLGPFSARGTLRHGVNGSAALTLGPLTAAGPAAHGVSGSAALTLGAISASGTLTHPVSAVQAFIDGGGAPLLARAIEQKLRPKAKKAARPGRVLRAAPAAAPVTARADLALGAFRAAGIVEHLAPVEARGALTLPGFTAAGSATFAHNEFSRLAKAARLGRKADVVDLIDLLDLEAMTQRAA